MFWKIAIVGVMSMAVLHTKGADTELNLDRALQQYPEKVKIGDKRTFEEVKASLIPRPEGYENPKNWTTDSALRLLYFIAENKTATSLQQTLRKVFANAVAAGSTEVKLRGTEDSVVQIDNHMRVDLPSARLALNTFIELLLPKLPSVWLTLSGPTTSSSLEVSAGDAIPVVPGDNSHYVEGESRYIWMPDGEGIPHLVDLHEPAQEDFIQNRNTANNAYWLFTRQNRNKHQLLINGNIDSVRSSNYKASRPLKVIVHGWNSNGNSAVNPQVTSAFLDTQDCNVIVVDWRGLANGGYSSAVRGAPAIGQSLGNFLVWLINNAGGNWNCVHLIGFSLGAHVVGNAGRAAGRRPSRITGLDPARPQWGGNPNALNRYDGQYVEAIHTDGGLLGIFDPIADADFYPNGGRNPQPGCWISTCSHSRAYELFAATVRYNHLNGRACSNINQVSNPNQCTGGTLRMGNGILNKRRSGIFALTTGRSFPF